MLYFVTTFFSPFLALTFEDTTEPPDVITEKSIQIWRRKFLRKISKRQSEWTISSLNKNFKWTFVKCSLDACSEGKGCPVKHVSIAFYSGGSLSSFYFFLLFVNRKRLFNNVMSLISHLTSGFLLFSIQVLNYTRACMGTDTGQKKGHL